MTDQTLQAIIDRVNGKKGQGFIYTQSIGDNVSFGMVWMDKDYHQLIDASPHLFYFIRDINGKCVGALLDMTDDLHGFIVPKSRKKGYLTNAFKQYIFPHLALSRKVQRVTINKDQIGEENYAASLRSSLMSGFKITGQEGEKTICELKLYKYKKVRLNIAPAGMTFHRMAELRKDINEHTVGLYRILAEVEMNLGDSKESQQLRRIINELQKFRIYKLEDTLYEYLENGGKPLD